jgi:hypothetical protein
MEKTSGGATTETRGAVSIRYRARRGGMDREPPGFQLRANGLRTTPKQTAVMLLINTLQCDYVTEQRTKLDLNRKWGDLG